MINEEQRYATLTWEKRWNGATAVATAVDIDGDQMMIVCCMGVMYVTREDLPNFEAHLRSAADLVKEMQS